MKKGLIQIYTGDGKGKTSAAVGQAVRALGHTLRVCYISFFKDPRKWGYGEMGILRKWGVDVYHFATKHPCFYKKIRKELVRQECLCALGFIAEIFERDYDLLVLDEINIALRDGFLKEDEILLLLKKKPKLLEVVLTGRGATPELIKRASLVTEMKKIKHPLNVGTKARKGIEY